MKDIKNLLKSQSSKVLPGEDVKIRLNEELGIADAEVEQTVRSGGAAAKVRRKVAVAAVTVAVAAVAVTSVALWLGSDRGGLPPVREFGFGNFASATDFYAYGAVSMGGMLSGYGKTDLSPMRVSLDGQYQTAALTSFVLASGSGVQTLSYSKATLTDEQKATVEEYLVFATGALGQGKIESAVVLSDRAEYRYMLNAGYADNFGLSASYILYFNSSGEIKDEKYALSGELIAGDTSYVVDGKYKSESKGDESENEISFKAYTSDDKSSYISLKYETEISSEETEHCYVISIYEDGKLVESASVSAEAEESETSYEIEIKRADGKIRLEFESADGGDMEVSADFNGDKISFIMRALPQSSGGGYEYIYDGKDDKEEDD